MRVYDWNLYAFALTIGSILLIRFGYAVLPDSWQGVPFFLSLVLYALAYPALGWAAIRVVWWAFQGSLPLMQSLLVLGITVVQAGATLFAFLLVMAEWYNGSLNN
jgi:hypothetical protein